MDLKLRFRDLLGILLWAPEKVYQLDYKADHASGTRRKSELTEGTIVFNCTFYHSGDSLKKS